MQHCTVACFVLKNDLVFFFFNQEDVKLPCIACLGVLEKNQEKSFIDKVSLPKL